MIAFTFSFVVVTSAMLDYLYLGTGWDGRVCGLKKCCTLPLGVTGSDRDEHLTLAASREQTGSNVTLRTSDVAPCNLWYLVLSFRKNPMSTRYPSR